MWFDILETEAVGPRLGRVRDLFVTAGGSVYLLGYLAWSFYAWRYELGPVPALRGQYFVAGLAVAFVIGPAVLIMVGTAYLAEVRWPAYLASRSRQTRFIIAAAMGTVLLITASICIFADDRRQLIAGFVASLLFPFVVSGVGVTGHSRRLVRFALAGYIAAISIGLALYLVEVHYVAWPQELGGGKPRLAYLNLKRSDIENSGLDHLINRAPHVNSPDSAIVSTLLLYVLIKTPESLLVSQYPPNRSHRGGCTYRGHGGQVAGDMVDTFKSPAQSLRGRVRWGGARCRSCPCVESL